MHQKLFYKFGTVEFSQSIGQSLYAQRQLNGFPPRQDKVIEPIVPSLLAQLHRPHPMCFEFMAPFQEE